MMGSIGVLAYGTVGLATVREDVATVYAACACRWRRQGELVKVTGLGRARVARACALGVLEHRLEKRAVAMTTCWRSTQWRAL